MPYIFYNIFRFLHASYISLYIIIVVVTSSLCSCCIPYLDECHSMLFPCHQMCLSYAILCQIRWCPPPLSTRLSCLSSVDVAFNVLCLSGIDYTHKTKFHVSFEFEKYTRRKGAWQRLLPISVDLKRMHNCDWRQFIDPFFNQDLFTRGMWRKQ